MTFVSQLQNPAGVWGEPIGQTTSYSPGNGGTQCIEVVNNSGAHLKHGDVCVWDTSTATSALQTLTVGAQQLAITATSYAVTTGSSTPFATTGPIVAMGVTPSVGPGVPQSLFGVISAKADADHITIAWAQAGAAGSLPAGTILFVPPSTVAGLDPSPIIAQPGTTTANMPAGGARYPAVTLSTTAAANDPLVAGVVCLTMDSSSSNALVPPGAAFPMAVGGIARVNIGTGTVAAGGLLCTAAAARPGIADDTPATIGCMLGIALEAQTAIDAYQTIRAIIKIG